MINECRYRNFIKPNRPYEIEGWFGDNDFDFYDLLFKTMNRGATFVEIGIWKGRSTIYFCELLRLNYKPILFECIDSFEGSVNEENLIKEAKEHNLYELFISTLKERGLLNYCNVHKQSSIESCRQFVDKSVDVVFIDGSHDYDSVKEDLINWIPKVKHGGTISGHDYNAWEGVTKAVNEVIGQPKIWNNSSCWFTLVG